MISGLFGLGIRNEFLELFFEQIILALELLDKTISLFDDLAQREPAVNACGFAKFIQA